MTEYTFPALRVEQPLGEFYVAVIPAKILLQVTYSDVYRYTSLDSTGIPLAEGHQRKLNPDRLRAIGRYIDTVESAFPNSIILAANYKESGELEEDESVRWSVTFDSSSNVGILKIPSLLRLAAVVDGQHRLNGFNEASSIRQDMPLLCAIYLDLPNPYQAYIFATINHNQKPVNKSLSYELYGYDLDDESTEAWSPEKLAVFFSRRLNSDSESVFCGHIAVIAQVEEALQMLSRQKLSGWLVSTATIVEGCLALFATNSKRDRDVMYKKTLEEGRSRKQLSEVDDSSPMRELYIAGNDLLIYTAVRNFFKAVHEVFWCIQDDPGFIRKTVGIQALFSILKLLCSEAISEKDISVAFFKKALAPAAGIDFNDRFFHASGAGKTRIRNTLCVALSLRELDDLSDKDKAEYIRILKAINGDA